MATTPPSSDPQVPGNYPGTVQNPTQVPAPVNPVTDPEVPALPNDVDPNFIPNPAPVNNTIDPEVPQPEENFPRKKRFDAEPVVPVTNPEVPQPQDSFPEEGIDFPAAPPAGVDPQISQPDSFPEEGIDLPQALPPAEPAANNTGFDDFYGDQTYTATGTGTADATPVAPANTGFDDYYGEQTYTTNYTGTADVPAGNTGFDDFYGEQTYTVNYTGTADTVPAGNTGFDDFYGDQTYTANFTGTADARPVIPATNSQVPNLFSSISSLLSSLFGIRPTVVSPAANPQVAQAFSVPAPTVFKPTPIPASTTTPTTTTTTNNSSGFGDFYGEQTYTANYTGTADAVPAANTGFDDFYGEQTYTANLTGTADATPVSPASNPEVPQPTPPAPTAESIVNQANPDLAQERFALKIQIERELQPQIARELQEQNPTWSPSRVFATSKLRAGAQADAAVDFRLDQQITAASQNPPTVTPEANPEVPQPTQEFSGRKKADPDIVDSPSEPAVQAQAETRIDGPVNQALLQQSNPAVATDYKSYVVDTQNKIVEQQTRELEASQGYPASENQIAVINGEAFGTATIAANVRFKNQIESADAAQSVPADTPPPTVAAPAVSPDSNAQVPSSANTRVENVNQAELAQKDPALYQQWQGTFAARTEQNTARAITAEEAVLGRPVTAEEKASIAGFSATQARFETNAIYQDELRAANAATVVPADTPPPTVAAPAVSPESNVQVPNTPTKIIAVSTETLLQNDPKTAQEYTDFRNEQTLALTSQRVVELEATTGTATTLAQQRQIAGQAFEDATTDANFRYQDQIQAAGAATVVPADTPPPTVIPPAQVFGTDPQVPQPDSFPEEGIDLPVAPAAGVDPQIPQPDSFPEEGIDQPAPVQSPSPYERFIAEEAAATDAAQAEATARFNAQFDVVTEDPQAFPVDSGAANPGRELAPVADTNTGYLDFNAADAAATAAADNIGEFQAEPAPVAITDGYLDFNAADAAATAAADDIGEFQAEPGTGDGESSGFSDFSDGIAAAGGNFFGNLAKSAGAVSGGSDPVAGIFDSIFGGDSPRANPKTTVSPQQAAANREKSAKAQAKQQNIINQQRKQANDGDWRVKLRLAGSADYLYNAPNPGILAPLSQASGTGGVIFPYTPTITTAYQAKYNAYELTHSNYKGYFYQGSSVGDITINANFTAQDTVEANYLLAVIHFFRSVTKMFYGQDDAARRGAPPPLVFLQGLGEYQFNLHPCVVSNFNYTMPNDVDYIRALSPNNSGTNLTNRRSLQSGVSPFVNPSTSRLQNAGLPQGGITTPTAPPTLGTNSPTYVPTKMEIQITLLAIQTRSQVSNQFSLKNFANGDLIKGGFW